MKLALMTGDLLPPVALRPEGFEAVQMFFGWGAGEDAQDPSAEEVDSVLQAADVALAAMTLHVDLVGPKGAVQDDVARLVRCVEKTAALDGRFGDNARPVLVWHPSDYGPTGSGCLDYPAYIGALQEWAQVPYFVLEYYKNRADLLKARDIVRACL